MLTETLTEADYSVADLLMAEERPSNPELFFHQFQRTHDSLVATIAKHSGNLGNETLRVAMRPFGGADHRLEFVATIGGVHFVNDSHATNTNAVWYALETLTTNVVLIMGGVSVKGHDYSILKPLIQDRVTAIVCLGKDNRDIHEAFSDLVDLSINTFSMRDAVAVAYHLAKKGTTVLLSPANASFDLFKNYEDRGDQFKTAVKEL